MSRGTGRDPLFDADWEAAEDRVREVVETDLPPRLVRLADEYDRLIGERDRFLWKWIYRLFDEFTLSCVPDRVAETVKTRKTELTVFVTTLDDLADNYGDEATFEQARRLPHDPATADPDAPGVDSVAVEFAGDLWDGFETELERAPRYEEFADVLSFDVRQVVDAMEYSIVVNDNRSMANLAGSRQYGPNNMVMFPYADVDLMYSPSFDAAEFGALRSLLWDLQRMARIGNWLTTWERELREEDYSAGVIVKAIEEGIVSDAPADPEEVEDRIKRAGVEETFRQEWRDRFRDAERRDLPIDSVDTDQLIQGMRTVMAFHVASYGYK